MAWGFSSLKMHAYRKPLQLPVIDTFAQGLAEIKTHFDARLSKKFDQTAAPHTHPGRAQQPNWAFEPCVGQLHTCPLMACMMPAQPQGFNASQLMMLPGLRQIPTAGKARNFAQLLSGPDPCNCGVVTQHKHVCGKLPGVPNIASGGPWAGRGENESCSRSNAACIT